MAASPRRRVRSEEGRSRRDRDAQLPGVVDRVLGGCFVGSGDRPAERVVDGTRARIRTERLRVGGRVRRRRAQRTSRRAPERAPRPARCHRRQSRARARGSGAAIRRCARRRGARRGAAQRRARSRGRRDDLLHLGHDRTAEGRARHPAQHLHQPHEPRVLRGPGSRPVGRTARPRCPAPGCRTRTCSQCRSSTPRDATPSSWRTSRSAGRS